MSDRELDLWIAEHIEGLVPGVNVGIAPEHQREREQDGSVDLYAWGNDYGDSGPYCDRCYAMPEHNYGQTIEDIEKEVGPCDIEPKEYSSDIKYAMPLAEKYSLAIVPLGDGYLAGKVDGLVYLSDDGRVELTMEHRVFSDTPALAICLCLKKCAKSARREEECK